MNLKLRGLDGRIKESEVETDVSFGMVCDQAGKDFGYHGRFTIRLPSGRLAPHSQNLEDNKEFVAQHEGYIFDLVQDAPESYVPQAKAPIADFKTPEAESPAFPVEVEKPVEAVRLSEEELNEEEKEEEPA